MHAHQQSTCPDLVLIIQNVWQIGRQALAIQERPIHTSQILKEYFGAFAGDLGMATRDPFFQGTIGGQIDVWKSRCCRIQSANTDFLGQRKLDLAPAVQDRQPHDHRLRTRAGERAGGAKVGL